MCKGKKINSIILLFIVALISVQISFSVTLIDTQDEFLTVEENDLQDDYINRLFRSNEEEIEALKVYEELYDYGWENKSNEEETVNVNRQRLIREFCWPADECEIKFSYRLIDERFGQSTLVSTECNIPDSICEMSCSPETEDDPLRVSISRKYWTQRSGTFGAWEFLNRETLTPNYAYDDRRHINYEISNNIAGRWYILASYMPGFYPSINIIENVIRFGFLFKQENICNNNRIGAYTEYAHLTKEERIFIEPEYEWEEGIYDTIDTPTYLSTVCICKMIKGEENGKRVVHLSVVEKP